MDLPGIRRATGLKPRETSYTRIRDIIRADIINGVLGAGERLKTVELAERYGVSQVPVREALQQLQGEGLVEIEPNRGASVRCIDSKFISDVFEIREALAGMLAAKAARLMTPEILRELEVQMVRFEAALDAKDLASALNANRLFHDIHIAAANNPEASAVQGRHSALLTTLRVRIGWSPFRETEMRDEHNALFNAFKKGDARGAALIFRKHARGALKDMLDRIQ